MWLLASCFAISFVLATVLSVGNLEFRANLTAKLNPPTNITIVDRQLGELTITWKDNLSEDIKKWSNVRYLFEFKYFDSDDWQEDSRHQDPEYMRTFELHRGVSLRVKNILLDKQRSIVINESNWTLKNIQPPPEIYNPPVNLKVLPNLTVKWEMPPGYVININCFAFELEVTDLDKCNTELLGLHGETEYVLVNINPMKRYSVKVRMKLKHCKETKFWSDWSNEDFIERIHSFNAYQMLLMLAIITAVTGLLLLFVFRRYKVLETVFKPIPDPQKKFKALFEEYNGDFQNWINCQIPISKADECHPVAVEESSEA
ncbi:erythropoietin receptor-like isoform X3 [Scyliorhinus canicula]|uniref:erythropoietin receptor-like isoform X3 n=1 Tax=Scyliorhinus canicula TaxID=7830 RepID=UPI0018F64742|nr:erythropoietin receptor-like isoform X3 [Scyliorhinus canicula]